MLGHHLNTITRGAEERLLTRPFKPYCETLGQDWRTVLANRCYMQVVHPKTSGIDAYLIGKRGYASPAGQYERLCSRFGSTRINRVIRERILNNQLWRAQVAERHKREAVAAGQP